MKKYLGIIAIILTFFGTEVMLDYWLDVQSIQIKLLFIIVVILIYITAIKQLETNTKN